MLRRLALASMFALAIGSPAVMAGCYELVGCSDSQYFAEDQLIQLGCEQLYDLRNMTYKEHGYCLTTQKAIERFGNDGCSITDAEQLPLNEHERANVLIIRRVEKAQDCN